MMPIKIRSLALLGSLALGASVLAQGSGIRQLPPSAPVKAVYMTTATMQPQFNPGAALKFFEKSHTPFSWPAGPANSLIAGGTLNTPRIEGAKRFPGISATGPEPPDPDIAVGPAHIVEVVNSDIAFINKATGAITLQQSAQTFFASINPEAFDFDPKVIFDQVSQRFVVVDLGLDETAATSSLLVAVSDDANPNGTWSLFKLDVKLTDSTGSSWLDYPGFGYNKNSIVFSGNMFPLGSAGPFGGQVICLDKQALYGGTATMVKFALPEHFTIQFAKTYDATTDAVYAVANRSQTQMTLFGVLNTGSNTFSVKQATVAVPQWFGYDSLATGPGGVQIQSNDPRQLVAAARNGRVVSSHCVGVSSSDRRCTSRWYEFKTNGWPMDPVAVPSLNQSGQLTPPANHVYNFPAVCIDTAGGIGLAFTKVGSSTPGDLLGTGRRASDPAGTMGLPITLDRSIGATYGGFSTRWGDYFDLELDPVDGRTMWAVGMGSGRDRRWQTFINKFNISLPDSALMSIFAQGVTPVAGRLTAGDRISLFNVDSNAYILRSEPIRGLGQVAGFNAVYRVPFTAIQTLKFSLRAAGVTGSSAQIQARNVNSGNYELLTSVSLTPAGVDKSVNFDASNVARFVGPGGEISIIVRGILPVRAGRMPGAFTFSTDRAILLGAEELN